jgi:hypothetical protein
MKTPPPGLLPDAGAEAEALFQEARRRQRRRHLVTGLTIVVLASAAGVAVSQLAPAAHPPARPGPRPASAQRSKSPPPAPRATAPRFFADTLTFAEGNGPWEVRASATGALVAGEGTRVRAGVAGLAATGMRSFVMAQAVSGRCATRLYRFRLSSGGRPAGLAPLGPQLPGQVWSLAASVGGRVIGYAISGCGKGAPGYIGVVNSRTGRLREWGDVAVGGMSPGNVALGGSLSMSANGRLLGFTGWDVSGNWHGVGRGRFVRQVVRVLKADAAAGTVAQRSHVVLRRLVSSPALAAMSLSPDGASFYLCTQDGRRAARITKIDSYQTATGKPQQLLAALKGTLSVTGCAMALDTTGRLLLVPYALNDAGHPVLKVARLDVTARTVTTLTIHLPVNGGMDPTTGMTAAW